MLLQREINNIESSEGQASPDPRQSAEYLTVPNSEHGGTNKTGGREDHLEFRWPFLAAVSFLFCL